MNARRALAALRNPSLLLDFDVSQVTSSMARKVKDTLKGEQLRQLLGELDAADEKAGELPSRKGDDRPKVGDSVLILACRDVSDSRFIGQVGILT